MSLPSWKFHPVVEDWFNRSYEAPTECQKEAWASIQAQQDVLVAAPTGSGKTLAAFLAAIDELVQEGVSESGLRNETRVLYVSPLKALSYDIEKNLVQPLSAIKQGLLARGIDNVDITTAVRTGDTTQWQRQKIARNPPHILVTTPESMYLMLTADSGRRVLQTVETLIIDEIHSVAGNKRGAHLSLSVARLEMLLQKKVRKIGLSATQKPVQKIAAYLTGTEKLKDCTVVDMGHIRAWDLDIEVPSSPLEAIMSTESWTEIYSKLAHLIQQHKTTLIFVNTRRHVERVTRHLAELIGDQNVGSHHGSLSKEHRHEMENKLKSGSLRALVATASLELGIDIGDINLVCQLSSPRAISVFLQRVGRSGHAIGKTPKGRIFPTTRDELVECAALLKAVRNGDLEDLKICRGSLDVLAQQIVAESCTRECGIDELFAGYTAVYPYRNLQLDEFHRILQMLTEGFTLRRGKQASYIHLDVVNRIIRGRRGARIVAATNAGAIPDLFDYDVILQPEELRIGTVNEDFAFESLVGDIFQLGNASYRILQVAKGRVQVEDAKGLPPNIPFWLGEGRGRSDALSNAVSVLRQRVDELLSKKSTAEVIEAIHHEYEIEIGIAEQIVKYLAAAKRALGVLPTTDRIVFERFFDETGDAHLVVHSVFGSRVNRAWGLALRKRFCVRFNFELQAAALEDSFVLSLGPTHSFALEEVKNYVKSISAKKTLEQAIFTAPMFATRWRWVANTSLAVLRFRNGKKVPAPFQRNDSEDLLSLVFPDQVACQENVVGPITVPDHPLVQQTICDCLYELMDTDHFIQVLETIEKSQIDVSFRDLPEASPLAHEILTAKPYAFLDDAPAEERRTLAVQTRLYVDSSKNDHYARLDPKVIDQLCGRAWPNPRSPEEFHHALVDLGYVRVDEAKPISQVRNNINLKSNTWVHYFKHLSNSARATVITTSNGVEMFAAAERLTEILIIHPHAKMQPVIAPFTLVSKGIGDPDDALVSILRSRLQLVGPCSAVQLSQSIDQSLKKIEAALLKLETEGFVMRGYFSEQSPEIQWCDRHFLARIHKQTIVKLRRKNQPVSQARFIRYLFEWMRYKSENIGEGIEALDSVIEQLEAYEAPAVLWESNLLPSRIFGYNPELLDHLAASGKIVWTRLSVPVRSQNHKRSKLRRFKSGTSINTVPLTFLQRSKLQIWKSLTGSEPIDPVNLSGNSRLIVEALEDYGPLFFDEILDEITQLPSHVEQGLVELFAHGIASCDHFGGIRALLTPEKKRRRRFIAGHFHSFGVQNSGRWSLVHNNRRKKSKSLGEEQIIGYSAQVLLRRYGVVFPALLQKERKFFPNWYRLRKIYRRMEDRGEVRGGRFVGGLAGEQYALPHAVKLLRATKRISPNGSAVKVHAADPLNLAGIVAWKSKVPAFNSNYLVYKNGSLVNIIENGQVQTVS